jgi:hypothetical protein
MKRQQKPFSVEIKKSRTQVPRHHLPPRHLFATPPDETSAFIQTAEPQAVSEPTAAPRILPSIIEPVIGNPESSEPVRRKRMVKSKNADGQIELNLPADGNRDPEDVPGMPSTIESGLQMDAARTADESIPPVPEVRVDDIKAHETKTRIQRKKLPEFGESVETSTLALQPSLAPEADSLRIPVIVTSLEAVSSRLSKRQVAATQLPRSERWKRRLHPATW